jgi:protease I
MEKSILMVIAPNRFRDEELLVPKKLFEDAGVDVTVASTRTGTATGKLGAKVNVMTNISDVKADDFDAVVFVGGGGVEEYDLHLNPEIHKLVHDSRNLDKVTAAICIAPMILAESGILKGKNVTTFPSSEDYITLRGGNLTKKPVTVDGKIVTGNGPDAAREFAKAILKILE